MAQTQVETPELAGLLATANEAYTKAEAMDGRSWVPPIEGRWRAQLSSFTYESRDGRNPEDPNYLLMRLGVTLLEGGLKDGTGDEFIGRECFIYFDDRETGQGKNKDHWQLKKLKGLTATLNEGDAIPDLPSTLQFMEAVVTDQMEVYLKCELRGYKDKNSGEDRQSTDLSIDGVVEKGPAPAAA